MSHPSPRPKRVFIGLGEVAGYFGGLREGFEELGLEVIQINDSADPFLYGARPTSANLSAISDRLHAYERQASGPRRHLVRPARLGLRAAKLPQRLLQLEHALRTCDVFVFGGVGSFLAGHDLRLIRRAGKHIVWIFTGSDHRPPYLNAKYVRELDTEDLIAETETFRRRVRHIERYAHAIVAQGPSAQLHARPFAEFLSVGVPVRAQRPASSATDVGPWPGADGVRILHCPTDPAKGSKVIRQSVERLRAKGLAVSYLELSGRPNEEVRARLQQSDLAIDQVYSDTPMAVFATEAALAGVPTVVGGYWAPDVASSLPDSVIPPSAFVLPSEIEATIERLVDNESERRVLGLRARDFVTREWHPRIVAERVLALAEGRQHDLVIREPTELTYCDGWGLSIESRREAVGRVLTVGGREGLGLSQNPRLEARMIQAARDPGGPAAW